MCAWAKIHDTILDDPDFVLTPATGWAWARMLTIAARNADNGRIGSARRVAHVLREDLAVVNAAVAELDGRIVERDGELWFRDWRDWQTMTGRERLQKHRAETAGRPVSEPEAERHETPCNAPKQTETPETLLDERRGEEKRTDPPLKPPPRAADPSAGATRGAAAPRKWTGLLGDISSAFGGVRVVNAKTGEPLAHVGQALAVIGEAAGDDEARARELFAQFRRSASWPYVGSLAVLAERFGKWAADGMPMDAARNGNGRPPRPGARPADETYTPASPEAVAAAKAKLAEITNRGT